MWGFAEIGYANPSILNLLSGQVKFEPCLHKKELGAQDVFTGDCEGLFE